ncbi:MAG: glycosyltransferase family 1 protein [bacterium]
MTIPLSVALVGAQWAKEAGGGATFEEDVLSAALASESSHRLVVYPANSRMKSVVKEADIASRVALVKQFREPRLPRRALSRVKRIVLRRKKSQATANLSDALRKAGAECAWMLGGSLVPVDLPYVATIWDLQHRVQPWFPEVSAGGEWRERERLYSEFVRRASAIIVGAAAGAREIRDAYGEPPGGTHVIPLPTPSFALFAGARPRLRRPVDLPPRYLFYPAQFLAHKNHITAVRVLDALRSMPDAPDLVFVGADKGTQKHVMREAEALGVARRVHALGFVDRERLVALYQHAEAMLYPSLFGPDNLASLEAMALGCPVIAARVDGAAEQIGDAGILVDPLDPRDYAAAVRALRENPHRCDELVERGRERARSWTATQYAAAVFALIDSRIAPVRALWP